MHLIVISGRSGSGKTTGLQVLEDLGYYCVDNLPIALLPTLAHQIKQEKNSPIQIPDLEKKSYETPENIAVGIDARNLPQQLNRFNVFYEELQNLDIDCDIIFLDSNDETLLKRFSSTRRKHPLTNQQTSLAEAIVEENHLLKPIENLAQLSIDTSNLTIHQLREAIKQQLFLDRDQQISILCQSFGFKHGIPTDADLVFDVRCLPNPYWNINLRSKTGLDQEVHDYLKSQESCQKMLASISQFLFEWLPEFEKNNRSYITVAIGCTGGQHRSVFMVEQLAKEVSKSFGKIQTRHREINVTLNNSVPA